MAASKNTTELAAYLATVEVTPGNIGETVRDLKDAINHLVDYVTETGTGTCVTNAVTINKRNGRISTESLTTAAGATQAITLTNDRIAAASNIVGSIALYAGTGLPIIKSIVCSAGSAVITLHNAHGAAALNDVVRIDFIIA